MSHKILEGKKGIIFGALDDKSIAWKTAESVADAGGIFVLTNAPVAIRMGNIEALAGKTDSKVIAADATNMDDLNHLIKKAQEILGSKLGFVLHSIGMSVEVRRASVRLSGSYPNAVAENTRSYALALTSNLIRFSVRLTSAPCHQTVTIPSLLGALVRSLFGPLGKPRPLETNCFNFLLGLKDTQTSRNSKNSGFFEMLLFCACPFWG